MQANQNSWKFQPYSMYSFWTTKELLPMQFPQVLQQEKRMASRVSFWLPRQTYLHLSILSTLAMPDGAKGLIFHHSCPPETTTIEANVSLPLMDFAPLPEQCVSPIPMEDLNACNLEWYFCSYAKHLAGIISEKMSYWWWYAKSQRIYLRDSNGQLTNWQLPHT